MRNRIRLGAALLTTAAVAVGGIAAASGGASAAGGSRLDDGKDLLSQAKITEQQAIRSAQSAASGSLDEVDLEHYDGRLVFNVDVGAKDVKVDASSGKVLAASTDD